MQEMNLPDSEASKIKSEILHKESESLRKKRQKISIFDFEPIKIIGKGAFGEVRVCRHIPTDDIIAIKKMRKDEMHKKNQVLHVRAERDVLSEAKNEWIVTLKFSFQDTKFLYLGMEFLAGGDLMSLLMARDILPEEEAKFYAAEMVLAIESVHLLNCIHRDLKPDNVLIDKDGHIKLSDFGLSKKLDIQLMNEQLNKVGVNEAKNVNSTASSYAQQFSQFKNLKQRKKRAYAFSTVGTPDYIAPEVFTQKGYGQEIDWWSLGVIMFEMMIGYPPFFSNSSAETCKKILDWKNTLNIRKEAHLTPEAEDILRRLINDPEKRLGRNGAEEIKRHPFFKGINWNHIKETMIPPFIPELDSNYDTKYFDDFDEDEPFYPLNLDQNQRSRFQKKDMCFVDFTYNRENDNNYRNNMVTALEIFDSIQENIKRINEEKKLLNKRNVIVNTDNFNRNSFSEYDNYEESYQKILPNTESSSISSQNRNYVMYNSNNIVHNNSFGFSNNASNSYSNQSKITKSKKIHSQKIEENCEEKTDCYQNSLGSNGYERGLINRLESKNPMNPLNNYITEYNMPKKPKIKTFFTNKTHYIPVNNNKTVTNQNRSDNAHQIPFKKPLSKGKITKKLDIKDILNPKDSKGKQIFRPLTQSNNTKNTSFQYQNQQKDSFKKVKATTPRIIKNENSCVLQEKNVGNVIGKIGGNVYKGGFTYVKPDINLNKQSLKRK